MANNYNYWVSLRGWMYNRIDPCTGNFTQEFQAGVEVFLDFASNQPYALDHNGKFPCPCNKCKNEVNLRRPKVSNHLYSKGFMPGYYVWYMHGEELDIDLGSSQGNTNYGSTSGNYQEDVPRFGGEYVDMVSDAFHGTMNPGNIYHDEYGSHQNTMGMNAESQNLYDMLEAAQDPLYNVVKVTLDYQLLLV